MAALEHWKLLNQRECFEDNLFNMRDASQTEMQLMEIKLKKYRHQLENYRHQLKKEQTKRKKSEQLARSLRTQNQEYERRIGESSSLEERVRELQSIVDDDKVVIADLKRQHEAMRSDHMSRLTKMEREHESTVKKLKSKHQSEMARLRAGFLQSVGVDPEMGVVWDVAAVIKELRTNNDSLRRRVEELAKMLARKNLSLMEALEACDDIAIEDQRIETQLHHFREHSREDMISPLSTPRSVPRSPRHRRTASDGLQNRPSLIRTASGGLRERVKTFHQKRKLLRQSSNQSVSDVLVLCGSGSPKPPQRRNSLIKLSKDSSKPQHRLQATW